MRKNPQNSRENAVIGSAPEAASSAGRPTGEEGAEVKTGAGFGSQALGRLVRSGAGHDKGTYLVIVGVEDENHVLVADGRLRSIQKPKRKKLRHITATEYGSGEIRKKLLENSPILDAELRRFIASAVGAEGKIITGKEE
ncbi:MAG: KOW domain-containing RNA-binding protein [Firmicutes bacterium]|nr:KOW domain-containing RNA-binding protein [Bacillota bacterium]